MLSLLLVLGREFHTLLPKRLDDLAGKDLGKCIAGVCFGLLP